MERSTRAFALAEVIVALFFVAILTYLIGGLSQQIFQFSKKTKQVGTILELRTKLAAIGKDPEKFLTKMQTVAIPGTSFLYNSCLTSTSNVISTFNCPAIKPGLINPLSSNYDAELAERAEGVYKVTDTPLVDSRGKKIAGTKADPFYLSSDGFECTATPQNKKCPLMSTGYFFRTNPADDQNPGDVKFVVKVENNIEAVAVNSGITPMKPQYMSIELGTQWAAAASVCPGSSIQVGVRTNGSPMCLIPVNCGSNSLLVGVKTNGAPDCKSIPACPSAKRIVLNESGDLECVGNTPCDVGEAHLGYYTGTSDPICSSPTSCSDGEVLLGSQCKKIDTCTAQETLTFRNNTFSCTETASVSNQECKRNGEFLVGFDANGKAKCERGLAGEAGKDGKDGKDASIDGTVCAVGSFVRGIRANGTIVCTTADNGADPEKQECEAGKVMKGIRANGTIICAADSSGGGGGLGYGQEWVSVLANRALATGYKNELVKPISVNLSLADHMIPYIKKPGGQWIPLTVSTSDRGPITFVVPPEHSYKVEGRGMPYVWNELK